MHVLRNNEARSRNHCSHGKAISITYSHRVSSINYPARKGHAPYYTVTCGPYDYHLFPTYLDLPQFSTLSQERHNFRKQFNDIKRVSIFCTTFVCNISHSAKNSARYYHNFFTNLHVKYPLILSDFNKT
jgi:hypothetical protein